MIARWIKWGLEWWGRNWLRFQMVATPLGSLLLTLWLSQVENVGWFWNSQAEFEVAAKFASGGILFYTASFAALETGVWLLMVLALKALENYEKRKQQRQRELLQRAAALALEALRRSEETGEPHEEILPETDLGRLAARLARVETILYQESPCDQAAGAFTWPADRSPGLFLSLFAYGIDVSPPLLG